MAERRTTRQHHLEGKLKEAKLELSEGGTRGPGGSGSEEMKRGRGEKEQGIGENIGGIRKRGREYKGGREEIKGKERKQSRMKEGRRRDGEQHKERY